jgi:hypothetical protein
MALSLLYIKNKHIKILIQILITICDGSDQNCFCYLAFEMYNCKYSHS